MAPVAVLDNEWFPRVHHDVLGRADLDNEEEGHWVTGGRGVLMCFMRCQGAELGPIQGVCRELDFCLKF